MVTVCPFFRATAAVQLGRYFAQPLNDDGVLLVSSVREVQAGDIHSPQHQVTDHLLRVADWADGADDLRTPAQRSGAL